MSKRINVSLTTPGQLDDCIAYLQGYVNSLDEKAMLIVDMLANIGITALRAYVKPISPFYKEGSEGGTLTTNRTSLSETNDGWEARVSLGGGQCVFVEFGAGVTFNGAKGTSKHPKGIENGFTIGSYNPSSPNATNPNGWWYTDKWGNSQHTYGTPTFAPLYKSSIDMLLAVEKIAKEVFNG